jgi:hypothetical protein
MREIVKEWLAEEGILKADVPDERAVFHYIVEFPPGSNQVSDVVKPVDKDFIVVVSGIVLAENHYRALHSLPPEKKKKMIHRWKMDLLFREAEFRMVPDAENVQRVEFSIPIYEDELTKSKLMGALREIFKCKLYIIWNVQHEFDKPGFDTMYL